MQGNAAGAGAGGGSCNERTLCADLPAGAGATVVAVLQHTSDRNYESESKPATARVSVPGAPRQLCRWQSMLMQPTGAVQATSYRAANQSPSKELEERNSEAQPQPREGHLRPTAGRSLRVRRICRRLPCATTFPRRPPSSPTSWPAPGSTPRSIHPCHHDRDHRRLSVSAAASCGRGRARPGGG